MSLHRPGSTLVDHLGKLEVDIMLTDTTFVVVSVMEGFGLVAVDVNVVGVWISRHSQASLMPSSP